MKTVAIHQAKNNLSGLIKQASQGEEVVMTSRNHLAVRLVPISVSKGRREPGALRGKLHVGKEFFEPLPPGELGD